MDLLGWGWLTLSGVYAAGYLNEMAIAITASNPTPVKSGFVNKHCSIEPSFE